MEIYNEFARIKINIDESGNGPRLKIYSVQTGNCLYLDALELEALTMQGQKIFEQFLQTPWGPEE